MVSTCFKRYYMCSYRGLKLRVAFSGRPIKVQEKTDTPENRHRGQWQHPKQHALRDLGVE
jgi:hypothetical protein